MATQPTPNKEAFGPLEDSDATRQAQHSRSNDSPTDVNNNAIIARRQAQTTVNAGDEFAAAAARRTIIADQNMPKT